MLGQNGSLFAWNLSINLPNLKSVGVKKDVICLELWNLLEKKLIKEKGRADPLRMPGPLEQHRAQLHWNRPRAHSATGHLPLTRAPRQAEKPTSPLRSRPRQAVDCHLRPGFHRPWFSTRAHGFVPPRVHPHLYPL
jgi:hypothetical protein